MKNNDKNSSAMQTPSRESDQNGNQKEEASKPRVPSDSDKLMECLYNECKRLFRKDFFIFLNSLAGEDLIYVGIEKARQCFEPERSRELEEHWSALATAKMPLPDSMESKRFLRPATPAPSTPRELSEYFKKPFANPWQANELAICRGILKDVGQYQYISFPFTSSASDQVAHIVFARNEQAPQIGQMSPCFSN